MIDFPSFYEEWKEERDLNRKFREETSDKIRDITTTLRGDGFSHDGLVGQVRRNQQSLEEMGKTLMQHDTDIEDAKKALRWGKRVAVAFGGLIGWLMQNSFISNFFNKN